ncbi:MAG TPA: toll/interleukin-1 receptor domain-containing protein [Povalibacter sp.]|jgi:hypothetical protein|nr:toll/interleukin-1 receptor domain-containing protein [Povalibacter sp.]
MTIKLFISHISEERDIAILLKHHITRDFGNHVDVFASSDSTSVHAGDIWLTAIKEALSDAAALIVLCSAHSVNRSWVQFELGGAWLKGVPIIPICHSGMNPNALPTPLSWLQGLVLNNEEHLRKLYKRVAQLMKSPFVPEIRDLSEMMRQIAILESRPQPEQDFGRHIDIVIPRPGVLREPSIADEVRVESNPISLDLFGLPPSESTTWRAIKAAAAKRPDQRWLHELQQSIYQASNNEPFRTVQAIYHGERGSYQPYIARRELLPDRSCRFRVHFVETTVAPLMEVQNDLGLLVTLLRLGLRFRFEVMERYRNRTAGKSRAALDAQHEELLTQVRSAIQVIMADAQSRGSSNFDREALVAVFDNEEDQSEIVQLQEMWEVAYASIFNERPRTSVDELKQAMDGLREMNFRFMSLASRRYHEMIVKRLKPLPAAKSPAMPAPGIRSAFERPPGIL